MAIAVGEVSLRRILIIIVSYTLPVLSIPPILIPEDPSASRTHTRTHTRIPRTDNAVHAQAMSSQAGVWGTQVWLSCTLSTILIDQIDLIDRRSIVVKTTNCTKYAAEPSSILNTLPLIPIGIFIFPT